MHTLAEIKAHFTTGAASVTLTKEEWEAICETLRSYAATGNERRRAMEETERVKRIARPLWRACKQVADRMRRALERGPMAIRADLVADWERHLRNAQEVDWHDLPAGHPGRQRKWR